MKRIKIKVSLPDFASIVIPLIGKITPSTIASQIIGVQPMSNPSGLIYSMKGTYEKGQDQSIVE